MELDIKAAIEYIENHLREMIDLEACARAAYLSLMQLYREFYSVTGHSLKDYIRKKRVSNVCFDLKYTGNSVLDIALDNGFPMSASLNKVFKRTVGVIPLEYRTQDLYYYFPSALDHGPMQKAYPVKVENIEEIQGLSCSYYAENAADIEKQALAALMDILNAVPQRPANTL
jgi:AraC-like DNA-binding protein